MQAFAPNSRRPRAGLPSRHRRRCTNWQHVPDRCEANQAVRIWLACGKEAERSRAYRGTHPVMHSVSAALFRWSVLERAVRCRWDHRPAPCDRSPPHRSPALPAWAPPDGACRNCVNCLRGACLRPSIALCQRICSSAISVAAVAYDQEDTNKKPRRPGGGRRGQGAGTWG